MAMDTTEAGTDTIPDSVTILVVDDDERTSLLEQFVLEEEGYLVACAGSGEEALDMLDSTAPSLILLDIILPKMDGFITCQKIRENSQVPIIMLTGEGRDEEKIRGLEMGADDYITKPFSVTELTARVKAVLRRSNHIRSKTVAPTKGPPQPDTSFLEEPKKEDPSGEKPILEVPAGEEPVREVPTAEEPTSQEPVDINVGQSEDIPEKLSGQGEEQPVNENYEGAVKLVVQTTGAIKDMVDFVDTLREHPQFHLLRMVSNARRDGMDVWLRLRAPTPLQNTLLAAKGVTNVEPVKSAELDPETGAETRVLKVSLN